jgi:Tfp pilus assembly PilM family ATPase
MTDQDWRVGYAKTLTVVLNGAALNERDRFGLPVEPLNPFRRIAFDADRAGVDADEAASTAVVAVGLALRRAGDR